MRANIYDFGADASFVVENIKLPNMVPIVMDRRVAGIASDFQMLDGVMSADIRVSSDMESVHFALNLVRTADKGVSAIMNLTVGRKSLLDADNEFAVYVLSVPRSGTRSVALDLFEKGHMVVHEMVTQGGCVGFPWGQQAFNFERFIQQMASVKGRVVHLVRDPMKVVESLAAGDWLGCGAPEGVIWCHMLVKDLPTDVPRIRQAIALHEFITSHIESVATETWKVEDLSIGNVVQGGRGGRRPSENEWNEITPGDRRYLREFADRHGYGYSTESKIDVPALQAA